MGSHPLNLALRFLLELGALGALGWWGARQGAGAVGVALAVLLPLGAAIVWGVFAVPGDPSRSGRAPVPVRGWVRLALEGLFFVAAAGALFDLGQTALAFAFGAVVLVHYGVSHERVAWLLAR